MLGKCLFGVIKYHNKKCNFETQLEFANVRKIAVKLPMSIVLLAAGVTQSSFEKMVGTITLIMVS